jgi:hypothetical protein
MRFTPKSLRIMTMRVYLDNTTMQHNGFGYRDFRTMHEAGVNPSNLAKAFNVKTRATIIHWIKILKEELEIEHKNDIL